MPQGIDRVGRGGFDGTNRPASNIVNLIRWLRKKEKPKRYV